MHSIEEATLSGKKVLIRLGADLPMTDGSEPKILDDSRLRAFLPTLHYLLNRQASIVLCAHLGRPGGKIERRLSLRPVYLRLSALLKRPITFAPSLFSEKTKELIAGISEGQIVGLENLRFEPGEENNSRTFARRLSQYGDVYINEAFNVAHRQSASTVAITEFLPSYAGLSFEREVRLLTNLLRNPTRPFVVIVGGAKIADKLPTISALIKHADRVLVGGGVANTFLAAKDVDVQESLVDSNYFQAARQIIKRAGPKLILPSDFRIEGKQILDIGDQSVHQFLGYLKGAKTIFWSGPLGKTEIEEFSQSSDAIAHFLTDSPATTIVGGGNTLEIFSRLHLINKVSFASMGGSATLALLSGGQLPGLRSLD